MNAASSYLKLCNELNVAPISEFLSCLSAGLRSCFLQSPNVAWTETQIVALCAVLPHTDLMELSFHGLQLSPKSWVPLAEACSKAKMLRTLTVKDCNLNEGASVASIARALGASSLHALDMSQCQLGDEFIAALVETALLKNDKLYVLRLVECNISCDGACCLAWSMETLGMMTSLKVLDLSCNRIADRGACALAAMLMGAASAVPLHTLELEGNLVGDAGGMALSKAAKSALVLCRLNLSANAVTDATMLALADALRFNTGTLKEVALAGTRGGQEAAMALIRAATKNNGLTLLDIRGIPLGQEGIEQLCQMLRYTASLQTLRCDVASREGAEQVVRELPSNRSLQQLTLGGPVPEALLTQMSRVLAVNAARGNATAGFGRLPPTFDAWIDDATIAGPPAQHSISPGRSPRSSISGLTGSIMSRATTNARTTAMSVASGSVRPPRSVGNSPLAKNSLHETTAAGGARGKAAALFRKHDLNQDNYLDKGEMLQALQEVGILNGIGANKVGHFFDKQFKTADYDRDGKISMNDFITYYEKIAHYQTRLAREGRIKSHNLKSSLPVGTENNAALKKLFKGYAKSALGQGHQYGNEGVPHMNSQQFARLCQDAGFIEPQGRLSTTTVEVIFYRARPQGQRRLSFREFLDALATLAYEGALSFDDVLSALGCRGNLGGPLLLPPGSPGNLSVLPSESGSNATTPRSPVMSGGQPIISAEPLAALIRAQEAGTLSSQRRRGPSSVVSGRSNASGARSAVNPLYDSVEASAGLTATTFSVAAALSPASNGGGHNGSQWDSPTSATATRGGDGSVHSQYGSPANCGRGGNDVNHQQWGSPPPGNSNRAGNGSDGAAQHAPWLMRTTQEELQQRYDSPQSDGGRAMDLLRSRVEKLETLLTSSVAKTSDLRAVASQVESLQQQVHGLAEHVAAIKLNGGGGGPVGTGDGGAALAFAQQVDTLASKVGELSGELSALGSRLVDRDTVGALERRVFDRHARFEGALMQVAKQVDVLDTKLKDGQEEMRKAVAAK